MYAVYSYYFMYGNDYRYGRSSSLQCCYVTIDNYDGSIYIALFYSIFLSKQRKGKDVLKGIFKVWA